MRAPGSRGIRTPRPHPTLAPSIALALLALPASAQEITWTGAGEWSNPINWSPMNVPDNPSENATCGRPVNIQANLSVTIGTLRITDAVCTVAILQGRTIALAGPLISRGRVIVNTTNTTTNPSTFRLDSATTIGGTPGFQPGTIQLWGVLDAARLEAPLGVTQLAGHSITGRGSIIAGQPFINQGIIAPGVDNAGSLTLTGPFVNETTGILDIQLGGTAPGASDALLGPASWTLGGTLKLSIIPGYTPARGHTIRIMSSACTGRFDTILKPALPPGVSLSVLYLPNAIDIAFHCAPDLTTTAVPGSPGYGLPNGTLNNDDFFYYLALFAAGNLSADLTTTAVPGSPGYGIPNGVLNNDDFFYYLALFAAGC